MPKAPSHPTPHEVEQVLERFAPSRLAEEWDNVGVLLATSRSRIRGIMLTIDLTEAVLDEALGHGLDGIVAYHPPIFSPLERLADRTRVERTIRKAAAAGLWIASPHTALDAAAEGLNGWLAAGAGAGRCSPLVHAVESRPDQALKILTFVPVDSVDKVRAAMAAAGAGRIGAYSHCSFTGEGQGTFLGGESSNPAVGSRGRLESVEERRLEMVCGRTSLASAIAALRAAHPYEEPPIKIHRLEPPPIADAGQGRVNHLERPISISEFAARFKARLGLDVVEIADAGRRRVERVGVCAGSGGSLIDAAVAAGCDAFVTGEMSHHKVLEANERGLAVLLAGHTNTERPFLPILARRFRTALPGLAVRVSRRDRHPLKRI